MADAFDIPLYKKGEPLHARTVNILADEVRKLNRVRTGPGLAARMGPGGLTMGVAFPTVPINAVSTSAITAAPDADTLGAGTAMLRTRDEANLVDDEEVDVFSNMSVEIPSGTRLVVAWDGAGYLLLTADCPDTGGGA